MKMFSVNDYRKKRNEILNDKRYKDEYRADLLAKFDLENKEKARGLIRDLRKSAVISALQLRDAQEQRLDKTGRAIKNLDYSRLNYAAQAVRSQVLEGETLSDVLEAWENAKMSNDAYILKAWRDTSKGLISEKFSADNDYSDIKGKLFDDITSAEVKLENTEKTDDEIQALNELREIEAQAREINEVFGQGQAVVSRVLDGIRFEGGQVDLDFERKVNVFDKLERDSEVFNRLENDYTKGFENWQKNTKGLGDNFDPDFDDLGGAL
jgi:hypothetical protein